MDIKGVISIALLIIITCIIGVVRYNRYKVEELKQEIEQRDKMVMDLLETVNQRNIKVNQYLITRKAIVQNIDSLLDDRVTPDQREALEREALQYILNHQHHESE